MTQLVPGNNVHMDDSGPITDPAQLGCPAPPTGTTWPGAMQAIVGGQNTLPQASQTEQGRYSSAMLSHCFRTGFCLNLLMKNLSRFVVTHPQEADELRDFGTEHSAKNSMKRAREVLDPAHPSF